MTTHLTQPRQGLPSQIVPSAGPGLPPDVTQADRYIVLCDWHGRVVWKSATGDRVQIGEELWQRVASSSKECLQAAIGAVVTLRESRTLEVEHERGEHFRLWMWPLLDPEIAICILAMGIPCELALLTDRERACLNSVAQGHSTKDVAEELGIGLTTVHTHLRRAREKLGLASSDELIGFAARYFFVPPASLMGESPTQRKRSG